MRNVKNHLKEETYKVAGRPVTLIKGKKSNGTDWKVKFQNGKETSLSDVLALIKPFPPISVNENIFDAAKRFSDAFFDGLKANATNKAIEAAKKNPRVPPKIVQTMINIENASKQLQKMLRDLGE